MSADAPLTIRNITSTPIEIRSIGLLGHSIAAKVQDVVDGNPHQSGTTHQAVKETDAVSITVAPFETIETDIKLVSSRQHRLVLTYHDEEHSLDINAGKHESKDLASTSQSARTRLSAVYHPSSSHLTIFSSSKPASWMASLKNDTPISGLSIPGTHNSPACHHAFPSVRCQAVTPETQLQNGVRFFDIRVRVCDADSDKLELVHAIWPVSLTGRHWFRELVDAVFAFLDANPSETVLMTVKREGLGSFTDRQLSRVLHDFYAHDAARWFTAPRVPYLGEVRGKIVLIRRFGLDDSLEGEYGGAGWCLDASAWADNTPDALTGSGDLRVQDFYGVMRSSQIKTKTAYVTELMAKTSAIVSAVPSATATATRAAATSTVAPATVTGLPVAVSEFAVADRDDKQPIHVNFLSGSNFFNPRCWPEGIAAKLNPHVLEYLCTKHNLPSAGSDGQQLGVGDGCTGIVVCDWVGHRGNWDLVRAIVGWNARLEAREAGAL